VFVWETIEVWLESIAIVFDPLDVTANGLSVPMDARAAVHVHVHVHVIAIAIATDISSIVNIVVIIVMAMIMIMVGIGAIATAVRVPPAAIHSDSGSRRCAMICAASASLHLQLLRLDGNEVVGEVPQTMLYQQGSLVVRYGQRHVGTSTSTSTSIWYMLPRIDPMEMPWLARDWW
jgi:hypothetical protein